MFDSFSGILKMGGALSSDLVILAIVFFAFFFYTLYFGKNRTISLILAYYPAAFLYQSFPYLSKLLILHGDMASVLNKVGVFLVFLILISIVINRFIFAESGSGSMHFLRVGGLSLICLLLVLLFSYTVVDLSIFHDFGSAVDAIFATPERVWGVNLVPLILLAFI